MRYFLSMCVLLGAAIAVHYGQWPVLGVLALAFLALQPHP